ncbi:response regulator [Cereibacter azotoformans]|uniref:response regulator n=1 Tax=Cereibacter azotoformans TaxID=43057 RepID=UPI003B21C8B7
MPHLHLLPDPPPSPGPYRPRGPLPLAGLTLLAVEDSHFAAEAIRLLCHRSGARLRRADDLEGARKHLERYMPDAVIVDLGLPDGSGEMLIAQLAAGPGPVIIAASGDPTRREAALSAGAHAFLEKPLDSLALFQQVLLDHLPGRPRLVEDETLPPPDPFSLREDLNRAADLTTTVRPGTARARYLSGFVTGIARSCGDKALEQAAVAAPDSAEALDLLRRLISLRLEGPAATF